MTGKAVLAVVVSYNGAHSLRAGVTALRDQVARVHIVDNGSDDATIAVLAELEREGAATIERLGTNRGIGYALNRGVELARSLGMRWLLTMDQDSVVEAGFIAAYERAVQRRPEGICFAPTLRSHTAAAGDAAVTYAITSGMLVRMSAFDDVGLFDEGFFIDCIDFDFSLRLRRAGRQIYRVADAAMRHRLGDPVDVPRAVQRFYALHSPTRRYYMYRNYLYVAERHLLRFPKFILKLGLLQLLLLPLIARYDRDPWASFGAIARGVADYFARRRGPIPREPAAAA